MTERNAMMKKIFALALSLFIVCVSIQSCSRKPPYDEPELTLASSSTTAEYENVHIHSFSYSSAFEKGRCETCGETSGHCEVDGTYCVPLDNRSENRFFVVVNLEASEVSFVNYKYNHSTVLATDTVLAVNPEESSFTFSSPESEEPISVIYNPEEKTISIDNPIVPASPLQRFSDSTKKISLPTEHTWTLARCGKRSFCVVCREERGEPGEHKYIAPDCLNPLRCSECGETFGKPLGHSVENEKCTRCGKACHWGVRTYFDEFDRPTNKKYACLINGAKGTFTNTATTDSLLTVQVLADKKGVAILLRHYGSMDVRTSYSIDYTVKVLKDNGVVMTLDGRMSSDRIWFSSSGDKELLAALRSCKKLSFYIAQCDSATTYRFDINCSNFAEAYSEIF